MALVDFVLVEPFFEDGEGLRDDEVRFFVLVILR